MTTLEEQAILVYKEDVGRKHKEDVELKSDKDKLINDYMLGIVDFLSRNMGEEWTALIDMPALKESADSMLSDGDTELIVVRLKSKESLPILLFVRDKNWAKNCLCSRGYEFEFDFELDDEIAYFGEVCYLLADDPTYENRQTGTISDLLSVYGYCLSKWEPCPPDDMLKSKTTKIDEELDESYSLKRLACRIESDATVDGYYELTRNMLLLAILSELKNLNEILAVTTSPMRVREYH